MSINAINSMNISISKSNNELTDLTKKKLEALGVDTSKIKTESEGLQKLREAETSKNNQNNVQNNQAIQAQQQSSQAQSVQITQQVVALAQAVGVNISNNDTVNQILTNISYKIQQMAKQAGLDPERMREVQQYQDSLTLIISECANLQVQQQKEESQQSKITNTMTNLASYNKIFFNL